MKIKSVSGFTCHVKNLNKTASFYEGLGFEARKKNSQHITIYSNWFWIDFIVTARGSALRTPDAARPGTGIFIYMSVDDVDVFHRELMSHGYKPSGAPKDTAAGNREFGLRDPDGYQLVFFKRK